MNEILSNAMAIGKQLPVQKGDISMKWTSVRSLLLVAMLGIALVRGQRVYAASASDIDRDATAALRNLYGSTPSAKGLSHKAKGILIFPSIIKGGFVVGGQYGDGALRQGEKTVGYYRSIAASYGLQAGVQSFGYVLMFMDDASLAYLDKSGGWEIGTGPSVVIVDKGMGKSLTSTTVKSGVYAFIFGQKGLMAGIGLQGSKITKITPDK
jgi:lipid-binding SYLF domain-containing protein